ncbi:MAG: SAM-dependent methyltransferase [Micromonosporaceae bacterium]|nr:SAM-dependent methyltransferase [Micromonosporaceae bacterium]
MSEPAAGHLSRLDTTVAHSARLWNYLLGGKDHFAVDRAAGDKLLALLPEFGASARASRAFLRRAVRHLTADVGIRQFLDIGTGLPTAENTHEVAQAIAPESRILYVDNDPMVLAHARVLLTSTVEGRTDYLEADIRDPERIFKVAATTLDLDQPVGVILLGVLDFLPDDKEAYGAVKALVDAVAPGSHVVISHPTWEVNPVAVDRAIEIWNSHGCPPICARTPEAIAGFFAGLELLEPGVVSCSQWRPDNDVDATPVIDYGGVGRKP